MGTEKIQAVGLEKRGDGTFDTSKAALTLSGTAEQIIAAKNAIPQENILKDSDLRNLASRARRAQNDREKHRMIAQEARTHLRDVGKKVDDASIEATGKQILFQLRRFVTARIQESEVGEFRHYHRTSLENLATIASMGVLLSRPKLQERGVQVPEYSASDDVMFTRDKYDKEGHRTPGFSEGSGVGASGGGVMLVFGPDIMENTDYDATGLYPTISEISLSKCKTIVVDKREDVSRVRDMFKDQLLSPSVVAKEDWIG